MTDVAIRCEGVAKEYEIGEREAYKTIRDVITDAVAAPFRRLRSSVRHQANGHRRGKNPKIWALKNVSFEIKRGEVVGIIGRNGAGKSTLLKILSRVTEPTEGCVDIWGRVGSLLEVGTGFHPELTGRDNIFLNGAILGMRKAEIARKLDEIIAFAEVEKFIDTPVKRYSSGMYVRLAFAVAAHMETEVLLVDEVLAVGDAQFQKKCFEKFRQISSGGRTIVFVSHNMAALRTACETGIILERGGVTAKGEINALADQYLAGLSTQVGPESVETETFVVADVTVSSQEGPVIKTFDTVEIRARLFAKSEVQNPGMFVSILTLDNQRLAALAFNDFVKINRLKAGECCELGFRIERFPLLAGEYQIEIDVTDLDHYKIELVNKKYLFEVVESPVYKARKIDRWFGIVGLQAQAFGGPVASSMVNNTSEHV
jgi:lipopolysaccharide transport system ATP-binding protein